MRKRLVSSALPITQKQALYDDQLWKELGERNSAIAITEPFNNAEADDLLDRMLYTDFVTRLPEHSLVLTDRMSMAHGLEARSPFLDHELVEFLAKVPGNIKVQNNQPKHLMRKLAADYLPAPILNREKTGFHASDCLLVPNRSLSAGQPDAGEFALCEGRLVQKRSHRNVC